jgi:predicted nuclease with TOPRIM domain
MHDVFTVGIPLLAILAGIFFSRSDIKELRTEVKKEITDLRSDIDARFNKVDERFARIEDHLNRIDSDLRQFYHMAGKLEGRIESLEKR